MRTYHIVIGSKAFFDASLRDLNITLDAQSFLDLVRLADTAKQRGIVFSEVAEALILKNDNYLIISHKNPDGDTVGSCAALCSALRRMGMTAYLYRNPQITKKFLPYAEEFFAPEGFEGVQDWPKLAARLLHRGMDEQTVRNIFWHNAIGVMERAVCNHKK